jgi:hypothetical protein
MDRRLFLQASGLLLASPLLNAMPEMDSESFHFVGQSVSRNAQKLNYPLMDLHVHRSSNLSIEDIVAKGQCEKITVGIMENIAPWGIKNDEELQKYIDEVKEQPVFIGLQPMTTGWTKNFSAEKIALADYIIMDPQVVENGNKYGETINVWEYAAYIDDPEYFMERNMEHYMDILTNDEPLDVLACPLFLPACIEREYHKLWTRKRLDKIIDAANAKNVAIEINDTAHVPDEDFILSAKRAGLKFTFGSDTHNQNFGRLDYCKRVAMCCGLTDKDFFVPIKKS